MSARKNLNTTDTKNIFQWLNAYHKKFWIHKTQTPGNIIRRSNAFCHRKPCRDSMICGTFIAWPNVWQNLIISAPRCQTSPLPPFFLVHNRINRLRTTNHNIIIDKTSVNVLLILLWERDLKIAPHTERLSWIRKEAKKPVQSKLLRGDGIDAQLIL